MIIHKDCRHFRGDRPCLPHKRDGLCCKDCKLYDKVTKRILIIKLAADGDVLRTTCLLPALKEAFPKSHITWITETSAQLLLENNPLIDLIWAPPERFLPLLMTLSFDLVINTDADTYSCSLARLAKCEEKRGLMLDTLGNIQSMSDAAEEWVIMGLMDDLKKINKRSYPEIIYGITGLNGSVHGPQLFLEEREIVQAEKYLVGCGWRNKKNVPVVGVNTGAGRRWKRKALPIKTLEIIIEKLLKDSPQVEVFLLGGPRERERNLCLSRRFNGQVVDTGTDNSMRSFAGIVSHTDILLTADTLAMHIGIALGKYVVAHFGPTAPWEIDMRGSGAKIVPELECISCYLPDCDHRSACNEILSPDLIVDSIKKGINDRGVKRS